MRGSGLALAIVLAWSAAAHAQMPSGPPAVGVVQAKQMPITETNDFIGRVSAINRVVLVARVNAFLEQRLFVEGSEVRKGDLLYVLEQGPFQADVMAKQAAVQQANAVLQNDQITLDRAQRLLHTPAGQQSVVDDALSAQRAQAAQLLAAQANLASSQINLSYTRIMAPIDGKISQTLVTEGNVVSPSTGTLATIVSQDPIYVLFPIPSRTAIDLQQRYAGKGGFAAVTTRLRLPGGRLYEASGRLDYIDPTVATTTDTLTARAVFPNPLIAGMKPSEPGNRTLIDGEFVTVQVQGIAPVTVLGIPRAAILSDQQGDYVFTVGPDNIVAQKRVHLGQSTPETASIVSGLAEGDTVIVEGIQKVRPGIKVLPGPIAPGPTASPETLQGGN